MVRLVLIALILFSPLMLRKEKLELIAGNQTPGFKDGSDAFLNKPIRMCLYKDGALLFADINNNAIRKIDKNGLVETIIGGPDKKGFRDGLADSALLSSPHGVAYNFKTDKIYMASATNNVIREISQNNGKYSIKTFAGVNGKGGYKDGLIDSALFNSPHAVLVREDGALLVIDIGNAKLRLIKDGIVSTIAGKSETDPLQADFFYPIDIAMQGNDVLVADAGNNKLFRILPGKWAKEIELSDSLNTPHGISADNKGNIYIADMGTNRILKINNSGYVSELIGKVSDTTSVYSLKKPAAVLFEKNQLWIADLNNHQIKLLHF